MGVQESAQLVCRQCDWQQDCGPAQMLRWLGRANMTRPGAAPEPALLGELLRAAAPRLACPECGAVGLSVEVVDEDDEAWGMARRCDACGQAIPRERLEVFPDARLCVACQGKSDRGEATGPAEYCPRCGTVMELVASRRGVTRYVMRCPNCRR